MQRQALRAHGDQTSVQEAAGAGSQLWGCRGLPRQMESLIAFADNGLGGFSGISTFSWLASSLRGSAGRCYKRFINKMKCNARKSYSCKMHFPSHIAQAERHPM